MGWVQWLRPCGGQVDATVDRKGGWQSDAPVDGGSGSSPFGGRGTTTEREALEPQGSGRSACAAARVIALTLVIILPVLFDGEAAWARPTDASSVAERELVRLLDDAGLSVGTGAEARRIASNAGLSVEDALTLLRADARYADTLVPLVIESEVVESSDPRLALALRSGDFSALAASARRCGWAITKVNLRGGASGLTVAWQRLRTDWCWNSTRTRIVGTPTNDPPIGRITAYGTILGYAWKKAPTIDARHWVRSGWKYRISTTSTLAICPIRIDVCFGFTNPWIIHDMYGNGTVGKRYGY